MQQADKKADLTEPKKARATLYIATVKDTLSQQNYDLFSKALQHYKKTDDFHAMLSQMSALFIEDEKKHILLRGMMTSLVYLYAVTFVFFLRDFSISEISVLDLKYRSIRMIIMNVHHSISQITQKIFSI